MPYIITTTTPCGAQFRRCNDPSHADVRRHDVAALEEAREHAGREAEKHLPLVSEWPGAQEVYDACAALHESGGTIGPLPDGIVIKVEYREDGARLTVDPTEGAVTG